MRQLLFVRPDKIVIVDQLLAPATRRLPEVQWLLQLPKPPAIEGSVFSTSNGKSWVRCRPLWPTGSTPSVEATPVNTHRVSLRYRAESSLQMVHLIEVGDGLTPGEAAQASARPAENGIAFTLGERKYLFSTSAPFTVAEFK